MSAGIGLAKVGGQTVSMKRRRPRKARRPAAGNETVLCPVCLKPIELNDRVSGLGDNLLHERCDYAMKAKDTRRR